MKINPTTHLNKLLTKSKSFFNLKFNETLFKIARTNANKNIGYVFYDHEYNEYLKLDGKDTYVVENLKLEPKYNFIKR